jgi:membrane protease YdiL (CAAX protease family)
MQVIKQVALFIIFSIPIMYAFLFINARLNLGISEADIEIFLLPFLMLFYFWMVFPQLRKDFRNHFIKVKSLDKIIALPILVAILELVLVYLYFYFPVFFGGDTVPLGKSQYTGHQELSTAGDVILTGILGPFSEEFVFRFLLIVYAPYLLLYHIFVKEPLVLETDKQKKLAAPFLLLEKHANKIYYQAFQAKNKKLIGAWVIVCSFLFAIAHGPDIYSFALYFIPGLLFSYLFLRYGLLASWIGHGVSNIVSPYMNYIFYYFLHNQ